MSAVVVLGVSRSGTTLLKAMLDAHSQLAIPSESYFLPQLWDRHGERPERDAFVEDLTRLERVREWGVDPEDVRARLPERPTFAEAIQSIYRLYAEARGKARFGDKTPLYMQHLDVLERAFPGARYVHIVRDGRDAAFSLLAMTRKPRFNLSRPRGVGDFAVAWRREVRAAQVFGRTHAYHEIRYEDLVEQPESRLREVCVFLGLEYEPAMLEYHRREDPSLYADHPRLAEPPVRDTRSWRREMRPADAELFEAIAGDLLAELGYERAHPRHGRRARALAERAAYSMRLALWSKALPLVRKSPLWRARQVYIRRSR
ncbi:MAG: sulfotransferase [Actinobacteria bacterium]|nr:sulfotransferase [Actinomycetota bacterium]